jgi:hypothetical protein
LKTSGEVKPLRLFCKPPLGMEPMAKGISCRRVGM